METDAQAGYSELFNSKTIPYSEYDGMVPSVFEAHIEIFGIVTRIIELSGHQQRIIGIVL